MYFSVFIVIFLNFFMPVKTRMYKVAASRLSDVPMIENTKNLSYYSASLFNLHNSTMGLIIETRVNGSHVFIFTTTEISPNGSLITEPLKMENILPLNINLNMSLCNLRYPSVSFRNGSYYLVYNEENPNTSERVFGLAQTSTPLIPKSWIKIGNILSPEAYYPSTQSASILWGSQTSLENYFYFCYNSVVDNSGVTSVTRGTSPLAWEAPLKALLISRLHFFDEKGAQPGSSPIPLKSGDFLFLYTGTAYDTSIGYAILNQSNPSEVIQRSDVPIMKAKLPWEELGVTSQGLIPHPNGCPVNASDEIGPEYASNIECFLGVYGNNQNNLSFFVIISGWNDSISQSTTTSFSKKTTSSSIPSTETTKLSNTTTSITVVSSTSSTTDEIITQTSYSTTSPTSTSKTNLIVIICSVAVILVLISIILIIVYCYRKNKKRNSLMGLIVKQQEMPVKEAKILARNVDHFQLNLSQISINYDETIGNGSTATVYKGFLKGNSTVAKRSIASKQKYSNCKVAIKIPKEMNRSETEQIMREMQAMCQIGHHEHIAVLLGWFFQGDLVSLVFELAQQDLFSYICKFRDTPKTCLPMKQLLSIAWQVSVGMQHVASFNMVHRDLAARNILLYNGLHAKISDFGLCCRCDESFTYQATLDKKLPLRWLSIEALVDRCFSEKSDVWAFGILMYEMCTNGAVPYALMSNFDILNFLQNGQRLQQPETASEELYNLMLDCWKESMNDRLTFSNITMRLQSFLETETESYGYLSITVPENDAINY